MSRGAARRTLVLLLALAALGSGCAWSNRANRPVWNAFEDHLVPENDAAFYATLPLTVPAGLVSILTDTFIVHPVQVMPDAWGDAGDLWKEIPWERHYYTELASLPFRGVGSPVVLIASFLGRSAFDIPPRDGRKESETKPRAAAPIEPSMEQRQRDARALLERVGARDGDAQSLIATLRQMQWPEWSPELDQAWEQAVTRGAAEVRMQLFQLARERGLPPHRTDPARGLRDPSAVVRYREVRELPRSVSVTPDLVDALRNDPDEAVRECARARWP